VPALLYVRMVVACPIPGHGGLQAGRAPGYRYAARCMVRMGSACARLMLCERVWTGPGETLALGLHAHMRVFELGGWDLVLGICGSAAMMAGPARSVDCVGCTG
jgi:hypothetical protein